MDVATLRSRGYVTATFGKADFAAVERAFAAGRAFFALPRDAKEGD